MYLLHRNRFWRSNGLSLHDISSCHRGIRATFGLKYYLATHHYYCRSDGVWASPYLTPERSTYATIGRRECSSNQNSYESAMKPLPAPSTCHEKYYTTITSYLSHFSKSSSHSSPINRSAKAKERFLTLSSLVNLAISR